jgi:hypothetical protein
MGLKNLKNLKKKFKYVGNTEGVQIKGILLIENQFIK